MELKKRKHGVLQCSGNKMNFTFLLRPYKLAADAIFAFYVLSFTNSKNDPSKSSCRIFYVDRQI